MKNFNKNAEKLKINRQKIICAAEKIQPAFGRGEKIKINGKEIEIILVKNPAGFRINLQNFAQQLRFQFYLVL